MTEHSLPATEKISKGRTALFIIGMIWVAFNLRPAITSVGPLIGDIRQDLGISNGLAGLLTTLPVLGFALFSLLAPKMGNRLGNERTVFLGLIILTSGIVIRSSGPIAAVFAGIRSARMIIYSYTMTGVMAAIAGILLSGRTNSAKADFGSSYLLQAVLIAVLGGTNPAGGKGRVAGVLLALVSLMLLSSGLQIMRVSNFLIDAIWGAFLVVVIAINYLRSAK